jgi:hypothetical protein
VKRLSRLDFPTPESPMRTTGRASAQPDEVTSGKRGTLEEELHVESAKGRH